MYEYEHSDSELDWSECRSLKREALNPLLLLYRQNVDKNSNKKKIRRPAMCLNASLVCLIIGLIKAQI